MRRTEEAFEGVGEFEVRFGERDELFLVCLDQPLDRSRGAGDVALERFAAPGGGVLAVSRRSISARTS
ncbi:MAG TPA: hypothetical protein VK217_11530, partial [Acidimicrobiales bacterium]|nr:hypothetical protein [Acidimicrobiales bacterium]